MQSANQNEYANKPIRHFVASSIKQENARKNYALQNAWNDHEIEGV